MSNRAVLYARISSEDRDQFVPKLPDQLKMCNDYAQQRKYEIVEEIVDVNTVINPKIRYNEL